MKLYKFLIAVIIIAIVGVLIFMFINPNGLPDFSGNSTSSSDDNNESSKPVVTIKPTVKPTEKPKEESDVLPSATPKPTASPEINENNDVVVDEDTDTDTDIDNDSIYGETPKVKGDKNFVTAFTGNRIDTVLETEIALASSAYLMQSAIENATDEWETQIDITVSALKIEMSSSNELNGILNDLEKWENEMPSQIDNIVGKHSNSDAYEKTEGQYEIMLLYREKAAELMNELYKQTNKVDFSGELG